MRKHLPWAAAAALVACGLVSATPAQALSCAPADVWANSVDDDNGDHTLARFSVEPGTGDLTLVSSVPLARVYGDIAIATEDGDVWGTDFLPAVPEDNGFFRIDPATGAEVDRVALAPELTATVGQAIQLNALSFRPDGRVYTAPGWSTNVVVVDLADGSWSRPTVEDLPILEPTWDDHFSAGDFLTLESGEVLAVANAQEDLADASTIISYLVIFDFDAGTSRIIGRMSHWVNGAAQSGSWAYFAGQSGTIERLSLDTLPTDEDPARDLTPLLATAYDLPGGKWFGIASPQDSGVCPPVVVVVEEAAPTLPDTGRPLDGALLALGGAALLAAGAAIAVRRPRPRS